MLICDHLSTKCWEIMKASFFSVFICSIGYISFFKLAAALKSVGVDEREIRSTLHTEAAHAHSLRERRAEISSSIRSLRSLGILGTGTKRA